MLLTSSVWDSQPFCVSVQHHVGAASLSGSFLLLTGDPVYT
jgi:hypothetical protein